MIRVTLIPVLDDNYAYLLQSEDGLVGVVDPGEAPPVIDYLEQHNLKLDYIFNTHHHGDHIGGNAALMEHYGAKLVGSKAEEARIPGMDILLGEGDAFAFGDEDFQILETPGHTHGHICFYAPQSEILFAGDTLFAMGCGRVFESSMEQMFASLQKLKALPLSTRLYCGHEYTLSNAKFCAHADTGNPYIQKRLIEVQALREKNTPTLPSTLVQEHKTNVFLRARTAEEFAALRTAKDSF